MQTGNTPDTPTHCEESDRMFNHMMAKLAAFKATGQFGEEFHSNQFPIFTGSPPDGHPYPAAFCTHPESEESGDNLDGREGKKVSFEDEDEVHTVPNQQQEDRYGTWMVDGIRESRHKTSRPVTPRAEPPSALPTHTACDDETIVLLDRDASSRYEQRREMVDKKRARYFTLRRGNWASHKLDQETLLKIPGGEMYSDTCTNEVFWKRMRVPSKAPFQRKKTVRGEKRKKRRSLREKGRHLDGEHVHKRRWCGNG